MLAHRKCAADIDLHQPLIIFDRIILDMPMDIDARRIDQTVNVARPFCYRLNDLFDPLFICDIRNMKTDRDTIPLAALLT